MHLSRLSRRHATHLACRPVTEPLERRVLLAASSGLAVGLAPDLLMPANSKVSDELLLAGARFEAQQTRRPGQPFAAPNGRWVIRENKIGVKAVADGPLSAMLDELAAMGFEPDLTHGAIATGLLPLSAIDQLESLASVRYIDPTLPAPPFAGATTTQGDLSLRADVARTVFGVDGSGSRVGVISDSYDRAAGSSAAADILSGDLPASANIQILNDTFVGQDEGRAMMQLVHDIAPGANLAFHTAFTPSGLTDLSLATAITSLTLNGSNIIVDDVGPADEPMFLDGLATGVIEAATAAGVTYFSSAANGGRLGYESAFQNSTITLIINGSSVGTLHDFNPGPGIDPTQRIFIPNGGVARLEFQWDEPWFSLNGVGSASDMDIYLLEPVTNTIVAFSTRNNAGGDAYEAMGFFNNNTGFTQFDVLITLRSGAAPGLMKYVSRQSSLAILEYATNSGTMIGHMNSVGGAAVGSAGWYNTPAFGVNPPIVQNGAPPGNYGSSVGGTPILFGAAGERLTTPIVRPQPRFTAPDHGNTTFFGGDIAADDDFFPNFAGTSAAAPHAAAVAALLRDASSTATPAQILAAMSLSAIDMDDPLLDGFQTGFDFATGMGLVQADLAVALVLPDLTPFQFNGWSDTIVISTVIGTNTDAAQLTTGDTLFIDAGILNQGGSATTGSFTNRLLLDGVEIASGPFNSNVPAGNGIAFLDVNIGQLSPGPHTLTVETDTSNVIFEGLEDNNSYTRNFTVVAPAVAPAVTVTQFLRETAPQRVTFTFDQDVSASLGADDFTGLGTPGVDYTLSYDALTNTATLTLASILANGSYTVTAIAAGITNAEGVPMEANEPFSFKFLLGDADNNATVDVADLGILASNWQASPRTFSQGNFDYSPNGLVDVADLGILASHWQASVLGPSASSEARAPARPFNILPRARRSMVELIELTVS